MYDLSLVTCFHLAANRFCKVMLQSFVGMQRSAPTFNPYNVQCILISQIMLFLADQHYYIVLCCNVEAHKFTNMPSVNLSNV